MALTDDYNVPALHTAYLEIKALAEAAIARARLHLELEDKPFENFKNSNGFSVQVQLDSLLDGNATNVTFYQRDEQGHGDTHTIQVPRAIILETMTVEEQEFMEYKRLKAKYEK
jgi:hypothetical protein